ncbi:D-alanyl-D-alanine carboxypeptidase, partial [bacterium]|nr:D-alanyl-D-alanine carboxypeptidase [bacterium]
MKKILLTIMAVTLFVQTAMAKGNSNIFDRASKYTGIHKGSVSVSVKNIETNKTVKSLHPNVQISPASTQKILTYFASYKTLGEDYNFTTKLYKTKNNDYYLVLGADPYLTGNDLKVLLSNIKIKKNETLKNFYIDDSILDNNNWGEGWQWDDSLNNLMPKFGAYNIDRNLYTIIINPTKLNSPADLFTEIFYPTTFIN